MMLVSESFLNWCYWLFLSYYRLIITTNFWHFGKAFKNTFHTWAEINTLVLKKIECEHLRESRYTNFIGDYALGPRYTIDICFMCFCLYVLEKSGKPKFCFSPDAAPFVPKNFHAANATQGDAKVSTLSVEAREFYPRNFVSQPEVSVAWCLLIVIISIRRYSDEHDIVVPSCCMISHMHIHAQLTLPQRTQTVLII